MKKETTREEALDNNMEEDLKNLYSYVVPGDIAEEYFATIKKHLQSLQDKTKIVSVIEEWIRSELGKNDISSLVPVSEDLNPYHCKKLRELQQIIKGDS